MEAAVLAAGLEETLAGEGPFTVFAPVDAAFAGLPPGTLDDILADTELLTAILTYHVLGADVRSTDLTDGQTATTLNGADVTVTIDNGMVFINNAQVIMADIVTDNGVVHVIDGILIPTTTSVEESLNLAKVNVFPNPATDFIEIDWSNADQNSGVLNVYNTAGQRIMENKPFRPGLKIDISDLTTGVYYLELKSGDSKSFKQLSVN